MNPVRTFVRACRRHSWLRNLARCRAALTVPVPPRLRAVSELRPLSTLLAPVASTRPHDRR